MTYSADAKAFLKTVTLLYVEDDCSTREQFAIFLNRMVGKLIIAADGQEGLDAFYAHRPDIIITDIQMPVMDGLTMAEKIHGAHPDLPVIFITAHEKSEYPGNITPIGVSRHVIKPVECDRLISCMLECAELVRLIRS